MGELVTDQDLQRARTDAAFRQQFYADHLDMLLEALNSARKIQNPSPIQTKMIKEGVDLAVKLADRLNAKPAMKPALSGHAAA